MGDKWALVQMTTDPDVPPEDAPFEEIKEYMHKVVKPCATVAREHQFFRDLKSAGMRSYVYFDTGQAFMPYAKTHFPESTFPGTGFRQENRESPTWLNDIGMDRARPGVTNRWLLRSLFQE